MTCLKSAPPLVKKLLSTAGNGSFKFPSARDRRIPSRVLGIRSINGQAEGEETRKHGTLAWRVDASGEVWWHEQKAQGRRPPE